MLVHAWQARRRWPLVVVLTVIALWSDFHVGAFFGVGLVGCLVAARFFALWRAEERGLLEGARHAYLSALEQIPDAAPTLLRLGSLLLAEAPERVGESLEGLLSVEPEHRATREGMEQARLRR